MNLSLSYPLSSKKKKNLIRYLLDGMIRSRKASHATVYLSRTQFTNRDIICTIKQCFESGFIECTLHNRIRIQHFRLNTNPDPIRIQGYDDQKLGKIYSWNFFYYIFLIKSYLSLGLHKGHPSYRRSLQPSKENIQHFKTWSFLTFFYFVHPIHPKMLRFYARSQPHRHVYCRPRLQCSPIFFLYELQT
jgi:hypothetical protein